MRLFRTDPQPLSYLKCVTQPKRWEGASCLSITHWLRTEYSLTRCRVSVCCARSQRPSESGNWDLDAPPVEAARITEKRHLHLDSLDFFPTHSETFGTFDSVAFCNLSYWVKIRDALSNENIVTGIFVSQVSLIFWLWCNFPLDL